MKKNTFHALFGDRDQAIRAIAALRALDRAGDRCEIDFYSGKLDDETLPLRATRAPLRLLEGGLLGAVLGALIGAFVVAPAGWANNSQAFTAAFCAVVGALLGALGGSLQGAAGPDPLIAALADELERGAVLVRFTAEDDFHLRAAEDLARKFGAKIFDRAGVAPVPRRLLRRLSLQHFP